MRKKIRIISSTQSLFTQQIPETLHPSLKKRNPENESSKKRSRAVDLPWALRVGHFSFVPNFPAEFLTHGCNNNGVVPPFSSLSGASRQRGTTRVFSLELDFSREHFDYKGFCRFFLCRGFLFGRGAAERWIFDLYSIVKGR